MEIPIINQLIHIKKLSLNAKRGFEIENLSADFSYTLTGLELKNLNLLTSGSVFKGNISLSY